MRFFTNKKSIFYFLAILLFLLSLAMSQLSSIVLFANNNFFAVRTILPDNQIRDVTFFDLSTYSGMEQTVHAYIYNRQDEPITIQIQVTTATTNEHGIIDYEVPAKEEDESLLFRIEDIVTTEEFVEIEAQGTYLLEIQINMPEAGYDGVIAGGISFSQVVNEEEQDEGIRHVFAFLTAILLWQGETDASPYPVLQGVSAYEMGQHTEVTMTIGNQEAVFFHQMHMAVAIYNEDGSELLYEYTRGEMQMAPNSNFDYLLTVTNGILEVDESYLLKLRLDGQDERSWEMEKRFTVLLPLVEEAEETYMEPIFDIQEWEPEEEIETAGNNWLLPLTIGIGTVLILLLIFLIIVHRQAMKQKEILLEQKRRFLLRMILADD